MSMGDKPEPKLQPLHPVYTVTSIQNKVLVLEGVEVTYSTWVKPLHLHATGYDGLPSPASTDTNYASWMKMAVVVLQWNYGILSYDYLLHVLDKESTAYAAWIHVQDIFLNNKASCAAALEHEFTNLSLKALPSVDAYCQRLKELAHQLNDVDCWSMRNVLFYNSFAAYLRNTMASLHISTKTFHLGKMHVACFNLKWGDNRLGKTLLQPPW